MTTLSPSFERDLAESLLDDVEHKAAGERGNIAFQAIQASHDHLRAWGNERDYDIESIIDSLETPVVERTPRGVTVRWGWAHKATPYFEFGTSDHTINGDPVLSFVWDTEDAPRWVKKEFDREAGGYRVFFDSVEVSGVAETRFIRHGLRTVRRALA